MATKRFLERNKKGVYFIGASDVSGERPYHGPVAQVSHDKDWLYIVTDDYEGYAMLNIEALPHLRRALASIAREKKK